MISAPTAPGDDEDDDRVMEHVACRCGRLAAVVLIEEHDSVTCLVRCSCGAFAPVAAGEERS